jgi:ectoine hydroxylase-related dioxygenase (phytanoyl-CoA dioxygenase family)
MKFDSINCKDALNQNGFIIIDNAFSDIEVAEINEFIETAFNDSDNFRKSKDLFAIRKVFIELPGLRKKIITDNITSIIKTLFGADYFLVKALYFDKPSLSNWFVSYHQDLSVSVNRKAEIKGFNYWTAKNNQYGVQPPIEILNTIYTIRIHLDNCTVKNGALYVIPGSHEKGIYRPEKIDWNTESEVVCEVPKGGIMIMKPLLLHASHKSTSDDKRRVLHLEFCNTELPEPISWAEKEIIFAK